MEIKSVFSTKTIESEAVSDLKDQLKDLNIKVLLFFASSNYDQHNLNYLMQQSFKDSSILGCSTSGELVSGKVLSNSVVAMAFDLEAIEDVKIEVIKNISQSVDVEPAFMSFEKHFGESSYSMDVKKYVGLILIDGLSKSEEKIMDKIGARTDVDFIGGSAADDLKFYKTYVYSEGNAYTDAAVIALLKPNIEFGIIKTQSFKVLDHIFCATKVDEENRKVLEFDNKPAAEVYAKALNVPVEEAQDHFMTNPVGLVIGEDNVYVRSPQQIIDNKEIMFYCNILEGMEVSLLQSTNIIEDTKRAIENKKHELGNICGMINFHCILRALELEKDGLSQEYGQLFSDIPTIGFSTYGEEYIGHINQTSTILAFKDTTKKD